LEDIFFLNNLPALLAVFLYGFFPLFMILDILLFMQKYELLKFPIFILHQIKSF